MRPVASILLTACLVVRIVAQEPTPHAALARIAELRDAIAHHDELYHRRAAPEISDFAYDELKRELAELERAYPAAAAAVPRPDALAASDDRTGAFPTRLHGEPMLGLEKTYAIADLRAWHARLARELGDTNLACMIEPKVDGIAISVTFERGELVRAVTRGNGMEGDDITANVCTIPGLPRRLAARARDGAANSIPERIEIRGEIFLTFAEFKRINREREAAGEAPFANPRSAAAGSAKLTDPQQAAARRLSIVFYGWGACEPRSARPATQQLFSAQLRAWGLPALEPATLVHGADEMCATVEALGRRRAQLAYPTDGAVVKLNAVARHEAVGRSAQAPRWALAFKFPPERVETQLLAITIQVGRTGVLTPVAELAPIEVAGSTIARASLHNRAGIAQRDLRVGDFVFVEKAGEIIPTVVGVNLARRATDSRPFVFPGTCPACSAAIAGVADESVLRCPNATCPGQLRRRLEHFAAAACLQIEGLGPATIDALVTHDRVKHAADLYRLSRADLLAAGADPAKSSDDLLAAIERSKRAELWRFIHGLSIPGIGESRARDLARQFRDLNALAHATPTDFADHGRGPPGAAVLAFFADPQNRALVAHLLAHGVQPVPPNTVATAAAAAGKTFVLTGKLPHLTRAEATRRIEAAGGIVSDGVSRQTDFVVVGDDPGAKLARARKLGIRVIDEAALLRLLASDL